MAFWQENRKKKRYESPAYEVEEIFEKMSLACPNLRHQFCKITVSDCDIQGGGQAGAS